MKALVIAIFLILQSGTLNAQECQRLFEGKVLSHRARVSLEAKSSLKEKMKNIWEIVHHGDIQYSYDPQTRRVRLTFLSRINEFQYRTAEALDAIYHRQVTKRLRQLKNRPFAQRLLYRLDSHFTHEFLNSLNFSEKKLIRSLIFKTPEQISKVEIEEFQNIKSKKPKLSELSILLKLNILERTYIYLKSFKNPQVETVSDKTWSLIDMVWRLHQRSLSSTLKTIVWFLNPLPKHFTLESKLQGIYAKIKYNHEKPLKDILTSKDLKIIEDKSAQADILAFYESYQGASGFRDLMHTVHRGVTNFFIKLPLIVASVVGGLASISQNPVSAPDYINQSFHEKSSTKVELILDSSPISHMAIRIGSTVYSPSQTSITIYHLSDYFQISSSLRQIETLELNLSGEQVSALRSKFDAVAWQRYNNHTFFFDCATVISDFLKESSDIKVPSVVDASPVFLLNYLKAQKQVNPVIGKSTDVYFGNSVSNLPRSVLGILQKNLEAKAFLLGSFYIQEKQQEIRNTTALFEKNEVYYANLKSIKDMHKAEYLKASWLEESLLSIELYKSKYRSTKEEVFNTYLQEELQSLRNHLLQISLIEAQNLEAETDATLRLNLQARLEALQELQKEVEALASVP